MNNFIIKSKNGPVFLQKLRNKRSRKIFSILLSSKKIYLVFARCIYRVGSIFFQCTLTTSTESPTMGVYGVLLKPFGHTSGFEKIYIFI